MKHQVKTGFINFKGTDESIRLKDTMAQRDHEKSLTESMTHGV